MRVHTSGWILRIVWNCPFTALSSMRSEFVYVLIFKYIRHIRRIQKDFHFFLGRGLRLYLLSTTLGKSSVLLRHSKRMHTYIYFFFPGKILSRLPSPALRKFDVLWSSHRFIHKPQLSIREKWVCLLVNIYLFISILLVSKFK